MNTTNTKSCDLSKCSSASSSCIACSADVFSNAHTTAESSELLPLKALSSKSRIYKIRYQFQAKEDGFRTNTGTSTHFVKVELLQSDGSSYTPTAKTKTKTFHIDQNARANPSAMISSDADAKFRLYQGEFELNKTLLVAKSALKLKITLPENKQTSFKDFRALS